MDNIGWQGMVFIWIAFLWPLMLGGSYLVWKRGFIRRKGKFFLTSVAVGYLALIVGNFVGAVILLGFVKIAGISGESPNHEIMVNALTAVIMVTLFSLPILSTHYLAKRYS